MPIERNETLDDLPSSRGARRQRQRRQRRDRRDRRDRRGAVLVEFAITSGILFVFFMASLDFARANLIRHTINNAAFEGARIGIIPGATAADCEAKTREILATGFVRNADVDVSPSTIEDDTEIIQVTVTVPLDDNLWAASRFFSAGSTVRRTSTIVRETY